MNRPTLIQLIGVAIAVTLLAIPTATMVYIIYSGSTALKILISILATTYVAYLFRKSHRRTGRIILASAFMGTLISGLVLDFSTLAFALLAVGLIWVVRSLLFYTSVLSVGVDLLLSVVSVASAFWSFSISGNIIAAVWCFFLVQALFVYVPRRVGSRKELRKKTMSQQRFAAAYRSAELALRAMRRRFDSQVTI